MAMQSLSPFGSLRVVCEASELLSEAFDSLDTTLRWTAKTSTGTATVASGALVCSSSTTASAYGGVYSKPTFSPRGMASEVFGFIVAFNANAIPNTLRVWGKFSIPTTPTLAVPVTDGYGFFLDGSGNLTLQVWAAGVQLASVPCRLDNAVTGLNGVLPTAGTPIGFGLEARAGEVYAYINSQVQAVGEIKGYNPAVQSLPIAVLCINASTSPATTAQMTLTQLAAADPGQNANAIADGANPWLRGTVKAASTPPVAADFAQVFALSPNLPAPTVHNLTAAATTNATSVKASAGRLTGLWLTNYSAAAKYFKLYNKASAPTVGTDVPLLTIPIPATANVFLPLSEFGLYLSTGIAYAITGALADSDTTALAAGDVKVLANYI